MKKRYGKSGFTLVEVLTVVTVIALIAAIAMPRFWRAHDRAQYTSCSQNLKTIATALETYAVENQLQADKYPTALTSLTPRYVSVLPVCPSALGLNVTNSYTSSYERSSDPAAYTIYCQGNYHQTVGYSANEPWYRSGEGLGPK
ncbi:MAG: prepilin-type N-terminal cleavage/methylation domain-containing protein [Armatimonadetes bacterium]|nr:prepilin-type N-terminal cleavage/methylation domain-containing protein [Armatimonadota bacterium]